MNHRPQLCILKIDKSLVGLVRIVNAENIGDNGEPPEEKNGGDVHLGPQLGVELVNCNYGNDDDGDIDEYFDKAAREEHDIEVDARAKVVVGPETLYRLTVGEVYGLNDNEPHRGDGNEYVGSKAVSWGAEDASVKQQNGNFDGVEDEEGDCDGDEDGLEKVLQLLNHHRVCRNLELMIDLANRLAISVSMDDAPEQGDLGPDETRDGEKRPPVVAMEARLELQLAPKADKAGDDDDGVAYDDRDQSTGFNHRGGVFLPSKAIKSLLNGSFHRE
jgi:hypothetical protein